VHVSPSWVKKFLICALCSIEIRKRFIRPTGAFSAIFSLIFDCYLWLLEASPQPYIGALRGPRPPENFRPLDPSFVPKAESWLRPWQSIHAGVNRVKWKGHDNQTRREAHTLGWKAPAPMPDTRPKPEEQLGDRTAGTSTVENPDARSPTFTGKWSRICGKSGAINDCRSAPRSSITFCYNHNSKWSFFHYLLLLYM